MTAVAKSTPRAIHDWLVHASAKLRSIESHNFRRTSVTGDINVPDTVLPDVSKRLLFRKECPKWGWLSNFAPYPITWERDGVSYKAITNEHGFQWAKFWKTDPEWAQAILRAASPVYAKRLGNNRSHPIDPNWNSNDKNGRPHKVNIMKRLLALKVKQHPDLAVKLLQTGSRELVEWAPWGDSFWGINKKHQGENWLGRLWMEIRHELRTGRSV
jgi:ribA/ribD-fused uncharacterized protein